MQEQQELAQLFGEVANNEIHRISKELGWDDGSTYKVLLHAAIAGTTAKLGGSDFKSGAISGAVNEIFINEIAKLGDPALMQWASYILGKTVAKLTHGNAETGGNVAASATKNNFLHFFMEDIIKSLDLDALNDDEYYLITGNFRGVAGGCIVAKNKVVYDVYSLDVAEFKFSKKTPNIKELFQFGNASTGKMLNFDSTFDAPDYSDKVTNYLTGPSIFGSLQGPLINGNFSFGGSGFQSEFGFNLSVPDKPKFSFGGSYVDEIGRIDSEDTWIWE